MEKSLTHPDETAWPASQRSDMIATWLIGSQIVATTFLQKLALPLSHTTQIFLALPLMLAATGAGVLLGRLEVRKTRLALYALMAGVISLMQLLGPNDFSAASLSLLLVVHLPYVFGLRRGLVRPGLELALFQRIMAIVAVAGILEFALQFVVGMKFAYALDTLFPKDWLVAGFNNLIPLHLGAHTYKSNGFFMLEPSMFSQFLAIGIVVEIMHFKRMKTLLLFSAALVTTYSGTGLIILASLVPFYLISHRRYLTLVALIVVLVGLITVAPIIGLESYVARAGEFENTNSSAYARFLSIFPTLRDFILPHTDTLLRGMGAGNFKEVFGHVDYAAHNPSWGKIAVEYGLIGMLVYFPLMINVFYTSPQYPYVKAAILIQFLFLAEYVLVPTAHNIILALVAWPAMSPPGRSKAVA